jgi:hypothetical protein
MKSTEGELTSFFDFQHPFPSSLGMMLSEKSRQDLEERG